MLRSKVCTGCGAEKRATLKNFYRHKSCRGGVSAVQRMQRGVGFPER